MAEQTFGPEGLTEEQLNAMEPGDRVVGKDGDVWTRDSYGNWTRDPYGDWDGGGSAFWRGVAVSQLVGYWGPVRKVV